MADWAAESGHWYDAATGEPRYRIVGANGVERDTTLRDARKHGWVPSVTTIMGCAKKWQLEDWKQRQAALAALTTSRQDGESDEAFVERILADSREQAKKAAERGSEIHAAVEAYYRKDADFIVVPKEIAPWVESISNLVDQQFGIQDWRPEKSFAHPLGYGGKVDLHSDSVLIDFKGKEKPREKWAVYDEHAMQLAAYAMGLGMRPFNFPRVKVADEGNSPTYADIRVNWPRTGIIFFDRDEPYSEYHEVKPAALERGWRMFEALLTYWKAANL